MRNVAFLVLVGAMFMTRAAGARGPGYDNDNNDYFDCVKYPNGHNGDYAECPDVKDEVENCPDPVPDYVFTGFMFWACVDYCDNPDDAYWSHNSPPEDRYMDDPEPGIEHWDSKCQVTCNCFCEV